MAPFRISLLFHKSTSASPLALIFGLQRLDALIVLAYIAAILLAAKLLSGRVKSGDDFFLAGRKLGRWLQFVLNFGNMTDPDAAVATASSVYRQGIGGVWLGLVPLFLTPFYWFMNVWFRRVRLVTIADLFADRFASRFLPALFAITNIVLTIFVIGFGNVVALKTLQPILAKPPAAYNAADRQIMADYAELQRDRLLPRTALTAVQAARFDALYDREARGEIHPFISYLRPAPFYAASSLLIAGFIALGGLEASAIVDALQTALIVAVSVLLLPFGLDRIGGLHGLHQRLAAPLFDLIGQGSSEYTGVSLAAFLLMSWVGILAAPGNMSISGSARNEFAARMGAVTGGFGKRLMTAAWGLCGLIALAFFRPPLADPDRAWGSLTAAILPSGLLGIMIVGVLGGKLARLGASSIVLSALVVKNLYEPLCPGRGERHYLLVARWTVPLVLGLGVVVALWINDAVALLKFIISFSVIWGAPILLIFLWRRLTATAVRVQVIACLLLFGVAPWFVTAIPSWRRASALTVRSQESPASSGARYRAPPSVYFETGLVRSDPSDPLSPAEGVGRFNIEVFLVSRLGCDAAALSPAGLLAVRYLVDTAVPLVLLIAISVCTARTESGRVARFYARLKTPVAFPAAADAAAVAASDSHPEANRHLKLLPHSDWEFTRWDRTDWVGFGACCAAAAACLTGFQALLRIGG